VYGRSLAGADPDALLYQAFAVDMLHDDGEFPVSFFQVKSDQPALKPFIGDTLIRLPMTMFCSLPYIRRANGASGAGAGLPS
jgi:hypothetical protein